MNDFFYIGGQMNVENLAGNQFVNFALAALTELPSVFIGELLCNSIGRRWSHVLCVMVATVFFGVNIFLSPGRYTVLDPLSMFLVVDRLLRTNLDYVTQPCDISHMTI